MRHFNIMPLLRYFIYGVRLQVFLWFRQEHKSKLQNSDEIRKIFNARQSYSQIVSQIYRKLYSKSSKY